MKVPPILKFFTKETKTKEIKETGNEEAEELLVKAIKINGSMELLSYAYLLKTIMIDGVCLFGSIKNIEARMIVFLMGY